MNRIRLFSLTLALLAMSMVAFAAPAAKGPAPAAKGEFSVWTMPKVMTTKTGCTASTTCASGAFLSCSSPVPGTCTATATYVECNGVRQDCPAPPACSLERECCDGSWVYCEGNTCSYTARGVRCDGITYNCPRCPLVP